MQVILDRFEGEYAVLELSDGNTVSIPRILVNGAQEGDLIKIEVLKDETNKRKDYIKTLMDNVFDN